MNPRVLVLVPVLAVGLSCGSSPAGETANQIYASVHRTTPVVQATGTPAPRLGATSDGRTAGAWGLGDPAYDVFMTFRDYDPAADIGGSVGIENLYKSLWMTGSFYDEMRAKCSTIGLTPVAAPFNIGTTQSYDCVVNDGSGKHGHASREAGGQKLGLTTWQVNYSNGQVEMGFQQFALQVASGDLVLDQVDFFTTSPGQGAGLRYHVEGNPGTHAFTLRGGRFGTAGWWITMVGTGISRGSGNHFLLKASTYGMTDQYICYPADVTEAQMQQVSWTDAAGVPAACAGYLARVDALVPFTRQDVPLAISDFTGSSIYLKW